MPSRSGFLALTWRNEAAEAAAAIIERLGAEPNWRAGATAGGWQIWTTAGAELGVTRLFGDHGLVLGEVFPVPGREREDPIVRPTGRVGVADLARALSRSRWGRFVALLAASKGQGVYRDPSGGLDAFVWSPEDGVHAVASEIERVPGWLRPRRWALDWNRIGLFLARPAAATAESLFEGMETIGPGDLWPMGEAGSEVSIWSPAGFAQPQVSGADAAAELRLRVQTCTDQIVRPHERLVVELSGGLDSSIVAGVLGELGLADRVAEWLNWNGGFGEGDERAYAQAVADRLGVRLSCRDMIPRRLDPADLAELAGAPWPAMNGVDADRDRDEAGRAAAANATAIVSGQGGDAIFFQMPSPAVLVDAVRRRGIGVLGGDLLPELARRCNVSVWEVLQRAPRDAPDSGRSPLIARELREAAAGLAHAWVREAEARGLPPGKRLHIEALATAHLYHGASRARRTAELLFPLLAQPVVELCLAIPADDLAGRAQDRAYARETFAAQIPDVVRHRRSKGAYNGYFGRLVANSTELLKPFLLEGCLLEAGLLDREQLEHALDPQAIMQGSQPTYVMWAACVEAWVRYWQVRLPDSLTASRWP